LRIAVVSPFVDRRHGTERALAELLERLARDYGCEIHLYAQHVEDMHLTPSLQGKSDDPGAIFWHRVPRVPGPHVVQFLAWMLLNGLLRRWHTFFGRVSCDLVFSPGINCLRPDVVIVHALFHRLQELSAKEKNEDAASAAAGFFRRLHRRVYYRLLTALERRTYSDPTVSLGAVSPRMARLLRNYFGREDVAIVSNGVDIGQFWLSSRLARRSAARQSFGFPQEDFVLLLIGNDLRVKGLPTVLEAMASLPQLPLRLLVVGSDNVKPFRALAVRLGVENRCRWQQPRPDVFDFYAAADVYVSPSLEDSFGLPVAEAMACGLPAITSAYAGIADFVHDGTDGFVMKEPRDARYLAQLIQQLQSGEELCQSVGEAASRKAFDWTWDRHAAAVWKLLSAAASKRGIVTAPK